jgi:hypothetical protein
MRGSRAAYAQYMSGAFAIKKQQMHINLTEII